MAVDSVNGKLSFDFSTDRSEAAQEARYEALKGKKVLWLTCYYTAEIYDSIKPIIEGVVDKGVELYVVFNKSDADKELKAKMDTDGFLAGHIFAETANDATACDSIFEAAVQIGIPFDAVFSPHEVVQPLIGELAERFGLPGNSREAYVNARNKRLSREVCSKAGIPCPKFGKISSLEDVETVINEVGLPVVLKPTAGSASEGVYKCNTLEEAMERFETITEEFRNNESFSWNPGCEISVLCEEYIDGDEFDVDLLMWNGKSVYAGVIDNWPTMEPTFMETGSNYPSLASPAVQQQLIDYSLSCVRALGFTQGCFHIEAKYSTAPHRQWVDSNGKKMGQSLLIEVNPRMGGGRTHKFHKDVFDVNMFDNFLMTACGIPICPPVAPEPLCALAEYEVCSEKTGVQLHDRWLDHLKDLPNVEKCDVYMEPGAKIKGTDTGIPQWIGLVMVKGDTAEDAVRFLQSLVPTIDPPILMDHEKPNGPGH
eukprot:comp19661_c0_seq1/m.23282 comp19661_c0_seq1/g.23282  ORF comp19661_c0_seq1/g.23282 comp19661_c0_seq1/m.23282 type:complete len:483 (-) comp19661_c0_seq1:147-1595(-)